MAVNLSPIGGVAGQFFDNNGDPLTGGKIYTYAAGTTTPQVTYTSSTGGTPHANPIILDAAGRVPGGEIWLSDGLQYKFILKTSSDVQIASYDNLSGINSNIVGYAAKSEVQTATAGQTVFTLTTIDYQPGTNTLSVFIDGVNQYAGDSYVETNSTTVTFSAGLHVGAEVKFTTTDILNNGAINAAAVAYDPPFSNSVATTAENKFAEVISVKDFGAVGDGIADDTAALVAAFSAAASRQVVGVSGEIYRFTSALNIYAGDFNGQGCTLRKDFAGTGIVVTGGSIYTYLRNFTLDTSVAQTATDYSAAASDHGINVTNTRVEIYSVTCRGHKGAGFYLNQTAPNMNKSKYLNIAANTNSLAGCYMTGNYPTADDMSVWEFNGRFQSNFGYGLFATTTCPLRNVDMWLYCEANFQGAAASGLTTSGGADFGRIRNSRIWAYVEQTTVCNELILRADCSGNYVQSVRANADEDYNGNNLWFWSSGKLANPYAVTPRQITLPGFIAPTARINVDGEYCRVLVSGNGGDFGSVEGYGGAGGLQQLRLLSADASTHAGVYNGGLDQNAAFEKHGAFTRQYANFNSVVPVGNQIKITVDVSDIVPRQGTGLLDIYLAANTDNNTARYYHKAFLAFSSRNGTTSSAWDTVETVQASAGFTLNSVTVSGLQAVLLYDLNAAIVGVSGYVLCHGSQGYMTSAVLSAP